jgi:long-chain acyl-CoA synthetase
LADRAQELDGDKRSNLPFDPVMTQTRPHASLVTSMLVQNLLEDSALRLPRKVALVCGTRRITYEEINAKANRLAGALIQAGLQPGDRVALFLNNTFEAVVTIFGVLKAGGVFVPVNHTTKSDKLLHILNHCRATAIVTDEHALAGSPGEGLLRGVPSLKALFICQGKLPRSTTADLRCRAFDAALESGSDQCPRVCARASDLACLLYTSGTTGEPKGVICGHENMVFACGAIADYLRNSEHDIVLNTLPLSFTYGLYQLLVSCRVGGTLVLENSFAFPTVILEKIQQEKVTGFPGVPTIYTLLLRCDLAAYDLSSLRYLTNAAAGLPVAQIVEIRRRLPHVAFVSMYGQTETARSLYLPPGSLDAKPSSVGIAIPGTEVWLQDESGQRLGPGAVGELVVRGRNVMRGYWENQTASAERFRLGSTPDEAIYFSDDLFRMDEDGCLYFVSRKDDIIKSRGEKVAPKEVEQVLLSLPGVVDAAVVGVPDPLLGQAVKAVIVRSRPDLQSSEVLAHCHARLEEFMVPRVVEFRECLPLTTSGKLNRKELL